MQDDSIVVKFEQVDEQVEGPVKRIVGLVKARHALQLFDTANLDANPRTAKTGNLTSDIIDSIETTPDIFAFKTKGILLGSSIYEPLERRRYRITFADENTEGVLDGGHNTLAIGIYLLKQVISNQKEINSIKSWSDFQKVWSKYASDINDLKNSTLGKENDPFNFLFPLEILVPSNIDDELIVDSFIESLLDICAARNNNVELTLETKANKKGFYDEIKSLLPPEIAKRVEWKTNDGGAIKVRDIIAMSWIPLNLIQPCGISVSPQNIYRNKGECAKQFDALMSKEEISKPTDGYLFELHNSAVYSALKVAADLPALYDQIYLEFPKAYNGDNEGRFGRISVVRMTKDMHRVPNTTFTNKQIEYKYPDGLIMPLLYGLQRLMEIDENGHVVWAYNASDFLKTHLVSIVRKYKVVLEAFKYDPQKIAKNEGTYDLILDAFETELLKLNQVSAGDEQ